MLISQYQKLQTVKRDVAMRRYNKLERAKKLRIASLAGFVYVPRLIKKKLQHKPNPSV